MSGLAGRRILVTGADSGIGLAFTEAAIADGARVAALVQTNSGTLDGIVDPPLRFVADLAAPAGTEDAVEAAVAALGGVDGLVASAGVFLHKGALDTALDDWDRVMDVNLRGAFLVAKSCARFMRSEGRGAIVLVSSQIAATGHTQAAAYAASKAGINGLVRSLALELAPDVRVNAVAPGPVETPMTAEARQDPDRLAALVASVPMRRLGAAAEIAAAIRFLLSDDASFVTGHVLAVDGGIAGL